jgi:hypothetical protein
MIRKFNFTGRKKIKRSRVQIQVFDGDNDFRYFNLSFQLDDLRLPPAAHIYIEAYHRSGYQRFDFGTVESPRQPDDRTLYAIPSTVTPLFRIKVVDRSGSHGRILAALDKIRPEGTQNAPAGSRSLLYVEYDDLGHRVWQLDLDSDWPVLRLHRDAEEIGMVAGSDPRFLSLVYPEVFRQILNRIIIVDQHTDADCDDDWPSLWLTLACSLPGVKTPPPNRQVNQPAWITEAVEAFCANTDVLEKFNQSLRTGK